MLTNLLKEAVKENGDGQNGTESEEEEGESESEEDEEPTMFKKINIPGPTDPQRPLPA